ncbi:MAG: ABC transporter permease, partial [Vicinamibacterales bacterium]
MHAWIGDLKASVRQLAQAPAFTVAAVAVLAIGIGLNAAMFSVVYALAFMGRAFHEPERMVQLYSSETARVDSFRPFSYAAYQELASRQDLFDGVLAHNPTLVGVTESNGDARRTFAELVSRNYFDVLGVPIIRGRGFTADEDQPGRDVPVVIATYSYWQRTGFDPGLIGKTARLNDRAFTVIGITPRGFSGTMTVFGPELFLPLGVFHTVANDFQGTATRSLERADSYNLFLSARLKPGVTLVGAAAQAATAGPQLARAFPVEYRDARVTLAALPRFGTSAAPRDESVIALLGAVMLGLTGAVLLTVCLNLAAMLLARGRARRKEFAIRLALGSGRLRIVRQLLT